MFDFKFDWCKEMELGVEQIDMEHQEMFRIGRDIEQLLTHYCMNVTAQQLLSIIGNLRDYVSYHFYHEEVIMEEKKYMGIVRHRAAHNIFKKKVMHISCRKMGENPNEILKEIKELLQSWLFEHILIYDKKLCDYLKQLP